MTSYLLYLDVRCRDSLRIRLNRGSALDPYGVVVKQVNSLARYRGRRALLSFIPPSPGQVYWCSAGLLAGLRELR